MFDFYYGLANGTVAGAVLTFVLMVVWIIRRDMRHRREATAEKVLRGDIATLRAKLDESNHWRTNYAQAVKDAEKERDAAIAAKEKDGNEPQP